MEEDQNELIGQSRLLHLYWYENISRLLALGIPAQREMSPVEYLGSLPEPKDYQQEPILSYLTIVDPKVSNSALIAMTGVENWEDSMEQSRNWSSFKEPNRPYLAFIEDVDLIDDLNNIPHPATLKEFLFAYIRNKTISLDTLRKGPVFFPASKIDSPHIQSYSPRSRDLILGAALIGGKVTLIAAEVQTIRPDDNRNVRILTARRYL